MKHLVRKTKLHELRARTVRCYLHSGIATGLLRRVTNPFDGGPMLHRSWGHPVLLHVPWRSHALRHACGRVYARG